MDENMYDVLKNAVKQMRLSGEDFIDCEHEKYGKFKVYISNGQ